jgi:hypothetical protein
MKEQGPAPDNMVALESTCFLNFDSGFCYPILLFPGGRFEFCREFDLILSVTRISSWNIIFS